MRNKPFLTVLFFFTAIASAMTQTPQAASISGSYKPLTSPLLDTINLVQQYALSATVICLALLASGWIGYVCHECSGLKKSGKKAGLSSAILLLGLIGLCTSGSSCTAAQRMMAAQYRTAQAAEANACPMNHHQAQSENMVWGSTANYNAYSNWRGPVYCKRCGQRIVNIHN